MQCPRCQQENPSGHKFCPGCGTPLHHPSGSTQPEQSYADLQHSLTEALARESAAGEILRVISGSPTDIQPVFDAIVRSAARLLAGHSANVLRVVGDELQLAALTSINEAADAETRATFPVPLAQAGVARHAIRTRRPYIVADVETDPLVTPRLRYTAPLRGFRSMLMVPMVRHEHPIGVITVTRQAPGGYSGDEVALLQIFADQAVIAIENVRLFTELQEKNRSLTQTHAQVSEALEQQTATSEILQAIAQAQTDAQPVFATIVQSAARLCHAFAAAVFLTDGRMLYEPANYGSSPEARAATRARYPRPVDMDTTVGMAVLTKSVVHVPDTEEPSAVAHVRQSGRIIGFRGCVTVPMLRENEAVGAIFVARREPGRFSDAEVTLLKTFADQAVIAIENVRLFKELQSSNRNLTRALDQQIATSEILGVISSSPTDVQPVFDAIVRSASRLCGGEFVIVTRYDGDLLHLAAQYNARPGSANLTERLFPRHLGRDLPSARAILDGAPAHIPDAAEDRDVSPDVARIARSFLSVPLIREDVPIGAIGVSRATAGPFAPEQIALLQTFADQAVIAIENVRLFKELESSNRGLRSALDTQTATSEILRVISSSPTDIGPVFQAIVTSGRRLCEAQHCALIGFDGETLSLLAMDSFSPTGEEAMRRAFPYRANRTGTAGRAVLDRRVVHNPDVMDDPDYAFKDVAATAGYRGHLGIPMFRGADVIGVLITSRTEPGTFAEAQIELLKTFADQAVIAIENVRLFKELETRNQELTVALAQQTATSEVLAVISAAQTAVQPVFEAIVQSARRLCDASYSSVYRLDGQLVHLVAHNHQTPEATDVPRYVWPMPLTGDSFVVRAIRENAVIHTDMQKDPPASAALTARGKAVGHRRILVVPMVREGKPIGAIHVSRVEATPFAEQHIALLKTFADQAVIAIENVRLFKELEAANRELAAASQHKSEFLANMSHELRTPLNAIIGFSEVLTDRMFGELNEKQEEYLKDIYASGTHLLSLINDILDLSKIEAGRMELELTDFHLPTALDNALTLVRERAGRRSIAVHTSIDNRLSQIQADERKIRQVVLNLLSNAIKFTPEGGRIEVAAVPKDGCVEVSVSDTGVGIAPEDQERVFEEFHQVGTAEKKAEGTGLGLTLCRNFIELHGGRIWVQSQVGVGSTFTFTIPVRQGE
jgi:GAF domain-containing protein